MSLQSGEWKINDNGVESTLTIGSVNPKNGEVTGQIATVGNFVGVWDETSRAFTFAVPIGGAGVLVQRFYKGFLFSTPRNPDPGQDVVWTLAGFVQVIDLPAAIENRGNARRTIFGWFAQITEVA